MNLASGQSDDFAGKPGAGTRARRRVAVVGLGFVGAANAIAIAGARSNDGLPLFDVAGIELPTDEGRHRAAELSAGRFPFATTDAALTEAARLAAQAGNLSAETSPDPVGRADIVVVDVGLDLEEKGAEPRLRRPPFEAAIRTVGQVMRPDALVLLESTVPPGTCETVVLPILREELQRRGLDADGIKLAYCYERVMPGDKYLDSITNMWRVYAGGSPAAAAEAEAFLSSFVDVAAKPLVRLPSLRAAEMAKVLENTYRAVNIALIDEWERFARRIDVDLFGVLEAIRVRPTHNNIRYPGLGVGGYCLSKDPMFGAVAARELYGLSDITFPLSLTSVAINDSMPLVTVSLLESELGGSVAGRRILVFGGSYRQDVGDTRLSPSATLIDGLLAKGAACEVVDPLVDSFPEVDAPLHREVPPPAGYDAVVMAVAHRPFAEFDLAAWCGTARPLVVDANGVLGAAEIGRLRGLGLKVAAIGRGA